MVKLLALLCVILCFLACNHNPESITMVEWIDFVKYGGQTYAGDWNVTTVAEENIGELLGYVEHVVPHEIKNFEEYTVPDNASPFRSAGTPFYDIPATENAIAVYDANEDVYYLYQLDE